MTDIGCGRHVRLARRSCDRTAVEQPPIPVIPERGARRLLAGPSDQVSPHVWRAPRFPAPEIAIPVDAAGAPTPNRAIALVGPVSLNQRFPSEPTPIRNGTLPAFKPAVNSVIVPLVVILPTASWSPGW